MQDATEDQRRRRHQYALAIRQENRQDRFAYTRARAQTRTNALLTAHDQLPRQIEDEPHGQEPPTEERLLTELDEILPENTQENQEKEAQQADQIEEEETRNRERKAAQTKQKPQENVRVSRPFRLLTPANRAVDQFSPKPFPEQTLTPTPQTDLIVVDPALRDFITDYEEKQYHLRGVEEAIACLQNREDELASHYGAIVLKKLLAALEAQAVRGVAQAVLDQQHIFLALIDTHAIATLHDLLRQQQHPQLQYYALWILSYLAATDEHCQLVTQGNTLPLLLDLFRHPSIYIAKAALWVVGNLADNYTNQLLDIKALTAVAAVADSTHEKETFDICIWIVTNLTRDVDMETHLEQMGTAVRLLCRALETGLTSIDDLEFHDAILALGFLIADESLMDRMARHGLIPFLISACLELRGQRAKSEHALYKLLSAFSESQDQYVVMAMVEFGVCELAELALVGSSECIAEDILFILSGAAATNTHCADHLLAREPLLAICAQRITAENLHIAREAAILFANLAKCANPELVFPCYTSNNIVDLALDALGEAEQAGEQGAMLLGALLQLLQTVLDCGSEPSNHDHGLNLFAEAIRRRADGSLAAILRLQDHSHSYISDRARVIIEDNFRDLLEREFATSDYL